jgi:uncharacterized membrane protein
MPFDGRLTLGGDMPHDRPVHTLLAGEADFHWRGHEVSRLEGFADAVFAFAITLLVVSLEVPKTYGELMDVMRGFAAFGVCFALLAVVWFGHYRFFRRYGLQSSWSVLLNCVLLFFVLFYVYPLKFLFVLVFTGGQIEVDQARTLFIVYGLGYAAVFLVFVLLYRHAWNLREELALNPVERMKTRHSLIDNVAMVIVGLVSALLALTVPADMVGLAGFFYFVIGIYFTVAGMLFERRLKRLKEETGAAPSPGEPPA